MTRVRGYAAQSATSPLEPFAFERREPGERDVLIELAYCGICHSDLHQVRDEWNVSSYPMVPGHEIAGRVTKVGRKVAKFKLGDLAGVGCFVDSCRQCPNCARGLEQHCQNGASWTYNSLEQDKKTRTYGGYSSHIVVDEAYALKIPAGMALERAAPLLCAGITTYSPLKRWKAGKDRRVAVMGLGGLGHMAVKIAAAMGAEVTVLSTSKAKEADAKRLGAHEFALSCEPEAVRKIGRRFDIMINTLSAQHDLGLYLGLLRTEGAMVLVGAPPKPLELSAFALIGGRQSVAGSNIGGLAETQEMLDFCAAKKALPDVEVIAMAQVNEAYERLLKSDVRYRFSIDLKTL